MGTGKYNWYLKCMPKISEISSRLDELIKDIKNMNGIRGIYVWGSYAKNVNNPDFRLRNIDLLARTRFFSGDLLSIDDNILHQSSSDEELENLGYDPQCVSFSKEFTKLSQYNLNRWAISSDRKLLHWGPISENPEESKSVHEDALKYAIKETNIDEHKINTSSDQTRKNWYKCFCRYIDNYYTDMPSGWYKMEDVKVKDLLKEAIKLL